MGWRPIPPPGRVGTCAGGRLLPKERPQKGANGVPRPPKGPSWAQKPPQGSQKKVPFTNPTVSSVQSVVPPWRSMEGFLWKSREIHENARKCTKIYGIHEITCKCMEIHGDPWKDLHGNPRKSLKMQEHVGKSLEIQGNQCCCCCWSSENLLDSAS